MNVEALKALYVALGGAAQDVANMTQNVEVLNAISAKYGGEESQLNAAAILDIADVADNIGGGGGDFSACNVTIATPGPRPEIAMAIAYESAPGEQAPIDKAIMPENVFDNGTYTAVMYGGAGVAIMMSSNCVFSEVEGNAQILNDNMVL